MTPVSFIMASRRKARELTLQLLFQEDITHYEADEIRRTFWESTPTDDETRQFAEYLFQRYILNRAEVDRRIGCHAENWRLGRMATVDRNILRMAVCEFLYTETPKIVIIDEAIEIARKYSTEESTEFVNGILDAIRVELEAFAPKNES